MEKSEFNREAFLKLFRLAQEAKRADPAKNKIQPLYLEALEEKTLAERNLRDISDKLSGLKSITEIRIDKAKQKIDDLKKDLKKAKKNNSSQHIIEGINKNIANACSARTLLVDFGEGISPLKKDEKNQLEKQEAIANEAIAKEALEAANAKINTLTPSYEEAIQPYEKYLSAITDALQQSRVNVIRKEYAEGIAENIYKAEPSKMPYMINRAFHTNFSTSLLSDKPVKKIDALISQLKNEAISGFGYTFHREKSSNYENKMNKADALSLLKDLASDPDYTSLEQCVTKVIKEHPDCKAGAKSRVKALLDKVLQESPQPPPGMGGPGG